MGRYDEYKAPVPPKGLPTNEDQVGSGDALASLPRSELEFSDFFRRWYPAIARCAYLIVQDSELSKDVAQEAFVRALVHWRRVEAYERPDLWVRRVAVRLAVRAARQSQRWGRALVDTDLVTHAAPQDLDLLREVGRLPAA